MGTTGVSSNVGYLGQMVAPNWFSLRKVRGHADTVVSEHGASCCRAEVSMNMDEFGYILRLYIYGGGGRTDLTRRQE